MGAEILPATPEEIAALIPHQGTMCLLDAVLASTPDTITCMARSHASPDNPLLRHGHLSAIHLCEYGAQAMAVHGGLTASKSSLWSRSGWLVALRDIQLEVAEVEPTGILTIHAQRIHTSSAASQYAFTVSREGQMLASGRATVAFRNSP